MSEQIQVREGVWRTRDGEQVEVRARRGRFETQFQWIGLLFGVLHLWRNDGRFSGERDHHCDLLAYVGPLPEAEPEATPQQTTTDTLAEIEEQANETLQEALGQALEQAYIADLKKAIDAVTAERDRLQRELADMTEHSAELLESAQQARDERDLLAQRLVTKPSEEALQKENSRKQIEINTLKDQLQDMTADRDEQSRLRETVDSTCRILGGEAKHWKNRAQEISDRLAVEITRAERAEAKARELQIELDAAGQQPAPADKSEQIERIWDESRERAVSGIIELLIPLQVATGTHAESVLQILPAVIRRYMDGGPDDVE
jgi:hypothetical protein